MGLRTYQATGVFMRAMEELVGLNLRVSGAENVPDRPTLFVVNHFTRFETFIIPYVTYRYTRKQVCCLADHALFKGWFGKYLRSCGVMSVREPLRNRMIIGDLITARNGWVIYPEGLMIKNKKLVHNGRLMLNCPGRQGPPHTGAAVLAMRAEMFRQRYLSAVESGDEKEVGHIADRFGLEGHGSVSRDGVVIVPVNITYYPLRPDSNVLHKMARLIRADLPDRVEEELRVEGKLLLGDTDMSIEFGNPIEVGPYLEGPVGALRRVAGRLHRPWGSDLGFKRQARQLSRVAMRDIYGRLEVNFDHLFCYGLRALRGAVIDQAAFRSALYLTALRLRRLSDVRLHPHLKSGMATLATGGRFEPLEDVLNLARSCGVLAESEGRYIIDRELLEQDHGFHEVRLGNAIGVIANELEPIRPVVRLLRRFVNLPGPILKRRIPRAVWEADRDVYERDLTGAGVSGERSSSTVGEPFFLEARDARVGVVLSHGYLAAPEEMRPLAEHLHAQGYSVYGVRLKGHGTSPEALSEVTWQDWVASLARGYAALRHHCDSVVLGGFSLGGVLALYLAATHHTDADPGLAGVFTINAPMRLRDHRNLAVPAVMWWNRLARSLKLNSATYDRVVNPTESPGINYEVNYLAGVRQVQHAIGAGKRVLSHVKVPAMVLQADQDPIVHPESGRLIYEGIGSDEKFLSELRFARHVTVRGEGSDLVFDKVGGFVRRLAEMGHLYPGAVSYRRN